MRVRRALARVSSHAELNGLLATVASLVVLVTGLFVALGIVGLDKTVTSLLAGVGIIGLALGFAFQNIASNFVSGVLLLTRRPFGANDVIRTNDFMGTVMDIDLRATVIRTFEGQLVTIPNNEVLQKPIVNFTASGQRRVDIPVGVSYGDDLAKAKRVAVAAVERIDYRDETRPVELFYEAFGDSSINFTLRFWIDFRTQPDYLLAPQRRDHEDQGGVRRQRHHDHVPDPHARLREGGRRNVRRGRGGRRHREPAGGAGRRPRGMTARAGSRVGAGDGPSPAPRAHRGVMR